MRPERGEYSPASATGIEAESKAGFPDQLNGYRREGRIWMGAVDIA